MYAGLISLLRIDTVVQTNACGPRFSSLSAPDEFFGIECLSGSGLLILTSHLNRLLVVNPRNGRAAVLVGVSGEAGDADGDALSEAQLTDPTGLCLVDGERKLLLTEYFPGLLREVTLPTSFDPRLF